VGAAPWAALFYLGPAAWRPLGAAGGRPHERHLLTWGRQPGGPWERRGGGPMGATILPGAGSLEAPGRGGQRGGGPMGGTILPGAGSLEAPGRGGRPHGRHHLTWGRQPGGPRERRAGGPMGGIILPGAGSLEAPGSGGGAAPWAAPSYLGPAAWRPLGVAGGRPHGRHHLTWGRQPGGSWERRAGGEGVAPWAAPSCRPAAASAALTSSHSPAANPASVSQSTKLIFP
jgi:hypothetical protein